MTAAQPFAELLIRPAVTHRGTFSTRSPSQTNRLHFCRSFSHGAERCSQRMEWTASRGRPGAALFVSALAQSRRHLRQTQREILRRYVVAVGIVSSPDRTGHLDARSSTIARRTGGNINRRKRPTDSALSDRTFRLARICTYQDISAHTHNRFRQDPASIPSRFGLYTVNEWLYHTLTASNSRSGAIFRGRSRWTFAEGIGQWKRHGRRDCEICLGDGHRLRRAVLISNPASRFKLPTKSGASFGPAAGSCVPHGPFAGLPSFGGSLRQSQPSSL